MDSLSKSIKILTDDHISEFKKTEKKIVENIKSGKKSCIMELQHLCLRDEIKSIENLINDKLVCLKNEISKTKEKKERFEEMDVLEKLNKPVVLSNNEEKKVPSLGVLYKIVLKLRDMDYKVAIKKHHIPL